MSAHDPALLIAAIYSAAWWVRHYKREGWRVSAAKRAQAMQQMGLAVRDAFNASDDFEPLLRAVVDSLVPEEPRF